MVKMLMVELSKKDTLKRCVRYLLRKFVLDVTFSLKFIIFVTLFKYQCYYTSQSILDLMCSVCVQARIHLCVCVHVHVCFNRYIG